MQRHLLICVLHPNALELKNWQVHILLFEMQNKFWSISTDTLFVTVHLEDVVPWQYLAKKNYGSSSRGLKVNVIL